MSKGLKGPLHKLAVHPDKEEITSRLMAGQSVREISKWLTLKYRGLSKRYRLSAPYIQKFRKEVLKIDGKVLDDIQKAKKEENEKLEEQYIKQAVQSTNAYREKINSIASSHLDVATRILQMDAVVGDRIEYWYNLLKDGGEVSTKCESELRKYIGQQMEILAQYKKLVEGMADKRVDYNVNITVMNEQIQAFHSVIRDLICEEMSYEKAIIFLDKLNTRLSSVSSVKELNAPNFTDVNFEEQK